MIIEGKKYPILYHYIPIYNLMLLLKEYEETGKFLLKSNTYGDDSGTFSYISLSRNPSMFSSALLLSKQLCRITLDGEILSNTYKISPYFDNQYKNEVGLEWEEKMKISKFSTYDRNNLNTWVGSRFEGDVTKSVIRIDILYKPLKHDDKNRQGYVTPLDKYDEFNFRSFYNQKDIDDDHRKMLVNLYKFLKSSNIDIPIKIVSKFVNHKYQDRYISKWTKMGFRINNLKNKI